MSKMSSFVTVCTKFFGAAVKGRMAGYALDMTNQISTDDLLFFNAVPAMLPVY